MAPLHLGLILPNYGEGLDVERLAAVAVAAEDAGFDSGWVTDHVIVPPEHAPIYGTIAEALVSLGFLAGRTKRLQLGVSALVVPQRNPLVALKQLTTLDFLSGGRIVTAVAAGWMEGEFAILGADFKRRGRVLNDWLRVAQSAFAQMPGRNSRSSTAGWRLLSSDRAGPSSGSRASPRPPCGARRSPASGIRSRSPPRRCGRWPRSSASCDLTAE